MLLINKENGQEAQPAILALRDKAIRDNFNQGWYFKLLFYLDKSDLPYLDYIQSTNSVHLQRSLMIGAVR